MTAKPNELLPAEDRDPTARCPRCKLTNWDCWCSDEELTEHLTAASTIPTDGETVPYSDDHLGIDKPSTSPTDGDAMLCGIEQPKRIWLLTYRHEGDICWSADPNPDDADEIETVEYIRADIVALSIQTISGKGMREALEECRLIVANLPHDESLLLAKIDAALVDQGERG